MVYDLFVREYMVKLAYSMVTSTFLIRLHTTFLLQKRVGQIKESVDSNDPEEKPKVSSSTTRKTTLHTLKLATNRQFHVTPISKLQQRR